MDITLLVIGVLMAAGASLWLTVVAFETSMAWGLFTLFVPVAAIIFGIKFWPKTARPFSYLMLGVGLMLAGYVYGEIGR